MEQELTLYIIISKGLNRERNIAKAKKEAKKVLEEILSQCKANKECLYYRGDNYFINIYLYTFTKRLDNNLLYQLKVLLIKATFTKISKLKVKNKTPQPYIKQVLKLKYNTALKLENK